LFFSFHGNARRKSDSESLGKGGNDVPNPDRCKKKYVAVPLGVIYDSLGDQMERGRIDIIVGSSTPSLIKN
jgi:hypothetical protein